MPITICVRASLIIVIRDIFGVREPGFCGSKVLSGNVSSEPPTVAQGALLAVRHLDTERGLNIDLLIAVALRARFENRQHHSKKFGLIL